MDEGSLLFFLYITLTNYLSIVGGILLWAVFVVFGVIAKRYEEVFGTPTGWRILMIAPSGILVYAVFQAMAFGAAGFMSTEQEWIAYSLVFLSGVVCIFGAARFKRVSDMVRRGR